MPETALTYRFRPPNLAGHTSVQVLEFANLALRRSIPAITKLWQDEAQKLAPFKTGKLKNNLRFNSFGGTKIRLNFIYYTLFVRRKQGDNDFLVKAITNTRQAAIQIIQLNFRFIIGP